MKRYKYNEKVFLNEDALSFYLLGVFCTDGNMSRKTQFTLVSKDEDWLEMIKDYICPQITIGGCNKVKRLCFNNANIFDWLMKHECVPRKSTRLKMPIIPNEYIYDFIRGCIDGDGSLGLYQCKDSRVKNPFVKGQVVIYSASKQFLSALQKILLLKGLELGLYQEKRKGIKKIGDRIIHSKSKLWKLQTARKRCAALLELCYYPGCFAMPRKLQKAQNIVAFYKQ